MLLDPVRICFEKVIKEGDNSCSTGAVPEISKVTPEKAGALFVAGYNGDEFQPGYQSGPGSVDPVELAKGFTALVYHIH